MASIGNLPSLDSTSLLNYFNAQISSQSSQHTSSVSSNATGTTAQTPPWETPAKSNDPARDAQILGLTKFVNLDTATLTTGSTSNAKTQEDNQKLFALYQGVNSLYYLASMAQRSTATAGQLVGFNSRFQKGLTQVESFVKTATFNDFTLQAGKTNAAVTSNVSMAFANFAYAGSTAVTDANIDKPLANVSAGDSFTIAVKKGGTTTNVAIDLSQVQGGLTIDNIVAYTNRQLAAAGFSTRFTRTITQGSVDDPTKASYGITITPSASETVSLSSASATPALYLAGTTGSTTATTTTSSVGGTKTTTTAPPDSQGNLLKLTNLSGALAGVFNATTNPSSGTTTAQSTVVDSNGNAYVIGNATGNFGNEINQGSQDVYLSKYDSAGNLQWAKLLGSAGSAAGYALALDPNGGVVIAGSTTADLTTSAVADGNTDSFAAKYDAQGNQTWVTQLQTLSNNQAAAVSVDASGNVYVGGQVTGVIGAGQTSGGGSDATVTKLDAKGKVVYEKQFGTSGSDSVAATATTADGGLVVASTENGEAFLTKYANGDATSAPAWKIDLGNLQNGALGGLAVSGNQIYLSGSTANTALTAGGQARIANASTGGTDAFVFNVTDSGGSATANTVSYVGTSGQDKGNALTVGPDGTVYLAGTTTGTFQGQSRNVANVNNAFVTALSGNGTVDWTRQFGGADGQSTAQGIAIDPTGASVLDALGLPRGTLAINQSVDLASQTTLRPGDSFNLNIQGTAARSTKITIEKGETLQSLVGKINDALLFNGKASVSFGSGGEALKIAVNPGVSAVLVAGPANSDALARLGIPAGALTAPAKTTASHTAAASSSSAATRVFGLGLTGTLDISTSSGAGAVHAQLANVLSAIRNAYQTINAPPAAASPTQQSSGTVSPYLQARAANYNLALSLFGAGSSGGTTA